MITWRSATPDAPRQAIPDGVAIEEHRSPVVADVIVMPVRTGHVEADPTIAGDEQIAGDAAAGPEVSDAWPVQAMLASRTLQHGDPVPLRSPRVRARGTRAGIHPPVTAG